MEPEDFEQRPVPDLPTFALAGIISIVSAYGGACMAGSGPGGWNIHLLFVIPIVVMTGLFVAAASVFAALPFARWAWPRFIILIGTNSAGSALVAFGAMKLLGS